MNRNVSSALEHSEQSDYRDADDLTKQDGGDNVVKNRGNLFTLPPHNHFFGKFGKKQLFYRQSKSMLSVEPTNDTSSESTLTPSDSTSIDEPNTTSTNDMLSPEPILNQQDTISDIETVPPNTHLCPVIYHPSIRAFTTVTENNDSTTPSFKRPPLSCIPKTAPDSRKSATIPLKKKTHKKIGPPKIIVRSTAASRGRIVAQSRENLKSEMTRPRTATLLNTERKLSLDEINEVKDIPRPITASHGRTNIPMPSNGFLASFHSNNHGESIESGYVNTENKPQYVSLNYLDNTSRIPSVYSYDMTPANPAERKPYKARQNPFQKIMPDHPDVPLLRQNVKFTKPTEKEADSSLVNNGFMARFRNSLRFSKAKSTTVLPVDKSPIDYNPTPLKSETQSMQLEDKSTPVHSSRSYTVINPNMDLIRPIITALEPNMDECEMEQ